MLLRSPPVELTTSVSIVLPSAAEKSRWTPCTVAGWTLPEIAFSFPDRVTVADIAACDTATVVTTRNKVVHMRRRVSDIQLGEGRSIAGICQLLGAGEVIDRRSSLERVMWTLAVQQGPVHLV